MIGEVGTTFLTGMRGGGVEKALNILSENKRKGKSDRGPLTRSKRRGKLPGPSGAGRRQQKKTRNKQGGGGKDLVEPSVEERGGKELLDFEKKFQGRSQGQ